MKYNKFSIGILNYIFSLIILLACMKNLFYLRCMKLSIVHDLAECIVGDLTPFCGVEPSEKHRQEDAAMKELTQMIGGSGTEIYSLYKVICYIYHVNLIRKIILVEILYCFGCRVSCFMNFHKHNSLVLILFFILLSLFSYFLLNTDKNCFNKVVVISCILNFFELSFQCIKICFRNSE